MRQGVGNSPYIQFLQATKICFGLAVSRTQAPTSLFPPCLHSARWKLIGRPPAVAAFGRARQGADKERPDSEAAAKFQSGSESRKEKTRSRPPRRFLPWTRWFPPSFKDDSLAVNQQAWMAVGLLCARPPRPVAAPAHRHVESVPPVPTTSISPLAPGNRKL